MLATPAMAQVDWGAIWDGQHGSSVCLGSYNEYLPNFINITSVKVDRVVFQMSELTLETLRIYAGQPAVNSIMARSC